MRDNLICCDFLCDDRHIFLFFIRRIVATSLSIEIDNRIKICVCCSYVCEFFVSQLANMVVAHFEMYGGKCECFSCFHKILFCFGIFITKTCYKVVLPTKFT